MAISILSIIAFAIMATFGLWLFRKFTKQCETDKTPKLDEEDKELISKYYENNN